MFTLLHKWYFRNRQYGGYSKLTYKMFNMHDTDTRLNKDICMTQIQDSTKIYAWHRYKTRQRYMHDTDTRLNKDICMTDTRQWHVNDTDTRQWHVNDTDTRQWHVNDTDTRQWHVNDTDTRQWHVNDTDTLVYDGQ